MGSPLQFSFGAGEDPIMGAYGAMQDEGQRRRAMEMMRLAGYGSMTYSGGAGGGVGFLGRSPMMGNPKFATGSMFQSGSSWQSIPSINFPSRGGMM